MPTTSESRFRRVQSGKSNSSRTIDRHNRSSTSPNTASSHLHRTRIDVNVEAIEDQIVSLSSNATHENTQIEAIQHEDEEEAVLTKIQEIVGNEEYQIEDDGELRLPEFKDIAVLTRTRDFGRELLSSAEEYDLPLAYEGGIELFRSDQAKLLLAWLRILESDSERGWAAVLEEAGYSLEEVRHILDHEAYPSNMQAFRAELEALETVGGSCRACLLSVWVRWIVCRRPFNDDSVGSQLDDPDSWGSDSVHRDWYR